MAQAAALAFKFVVTAGTKLLVKAGLSKAAALATSSFVVKTVALTAASAALNVIMAPRVDAAGAPEQWRPDPTAPVGVLVGTRGVGGQVIHKAAYGPDYRFLSFVSVISAAGPIKSFGAFKADRLTVTFGTNGVATNGGNYKDNMWLATEPGRQPQPAALIQSGLPGGGTLPNWGASHKASGKAHMVWTLRQDSKFETYAARPVPICSGAQGVYGYDPRLDSTWPGGSGPCRLNNPSTYVWINRPGLAALNWALGFRENGKVVAGMNLPISAIDVDAHVALENICDANDWTVSAWPTTADAKGEVYRAFLQAGGATYSTHAGQLSPILRTPKVSVATVSAADTAGPLELDTSTPILERYNTIVPSCVQEAHDWQVVPLEPVKEASYLAADGRETRKGITYSYVRDANQAAQLAAYDLVDSREGIRGRIVLKPHMRKLKPGHVFTITEPGFALDGVKCLVLKKVKDPARGTVTVTFRSESDGKHAYALGQTTVAPTPPVLSEFDPLDVPAPGAGAWSVARLVGDAPGLLITGALDADREARSLRVELRPMIDEGGEPLTYPDLETGWEHVGDYRIDVERIPVTGLRPQTPYEVAVSYISPFNVPGERRSLGVVTTGAMIATDARGIGGLSEEDVRQNFEDAERLAQTIWEDALDRHDDVRGILQEFGTAGAVTDAARVEAKAAADSATEAGNSASAAAGFTADAQTAATAAGESASAASVSAGAAAASANAAGQSASAAAGFRADASTFADNAEQYAQATLELRTEAQAAASNAASSAAQAATASNNAADAASLAEDKANTATAAASSATNSAASASESEARAAQNAVVSAIYGASAKQDVKDAEDFFTSDLSALNYEDGAFTGWTEEAISGGAVVVWSSVASPALCTRARFVPTPGRRYRATAVWRYVSGAPGDVTVGFRALNASSGAFVANRWATVEAGASGEWREASYDITATEAMAAESWCPVIRRTGATGRIEVRSLIWRDIDALRAVGQSQITVYSTADEAFAGLLQQVAIGPDSAGMRIALRNAGGAVASAINMATQRLGFGLSYDDPSIIIDPLNETIFALSPDRSVKTWEVITSTGQVIERKPDGTVINDNLDGGIQRDGIRPGALGSQGVAFENRHYFLPNNSTTRTAAQATSAFAPLSIETNAIAFPASEWVSVRAGITMKATSDMFGHFNGRIMLVRRATYPTAGQVTTTLAEDTPHFSVAVNGYWSSGNRRDAGKIELRPWVFEIFDNPPQNGGEDPVSIKYQLIVTAESIGGGYFENFNDNNGARRFYGDRAFVHAVEVASGPVGVDVRRSSSAPAALPSPPAVSITPGGNFLQWN
jgi:hypothetical protein